jgi:hypothetical protein
VLIVRVSAFNMADSNELFELKNYFAIGNFQAAINEATALAKVKLNEVYETEKDVYVYRAYIAQVCLMLII